MIIRPGKCVPLQGHKNTDFLLLQAFLFTINFAAVLFINENTCQSEIKRLQINAYFN